MSYFTHPEIAVQFCKSAHIKNALSNKQMMVYSILGGAFIALGGLLSLIVVGGMPNVTAGNPGISKFMFGAMFPLGLILVVLGGAELFTSDCAVIPFAVLNKQLKPTVIFRIWGISYIGNFLGALLVAYFFTYQTQILAKNPWQEATINIAVHKTENSFWVTFLKGVAANWLVCMAVWLSYAAKSIGGKIMALWFPVMCFVVLGMEHSVANMYFFPTAMLLGAPIDMYQFLVINLLPSTLGNIIGGVVLVALPYWYIFRQQIKTAASNEYDHHSSNTSSEKISQKRNHSVIN